MSAVTLDELEPLRADHRHWLIGKGVADEHIDSPWPLASLGNEIAIEVRDRFGNLIDIALWNIEAKRIGCVDGLAVAISEGLLDLDGGFPIPIWCRPLQWLRSGRLGIVPVNWRGVAARTVGRRLVAADQAERDEIAWRLGVCLAPIVVRRDGVVCRPDRRMPSPEELQALSEAPGTHWHHQHRTRSFRAATASVPEVVP